MRLPGHLETLGALRGHGLRLHLWHAGAPFPVRAGGLLVVGDDLGEGLSRGPGAFDCAELRRALAALDPGACGVFAGAPVPFAYWGIGMLSIAHAAGAVLVECEARTFEDWFRYTERHAPRSVRLDVAPAPMHAEAAPA